MSFSAALIWLMNRASMVDFLKELLQWSTKAESSMVTTSTSSNQVLMVVSRQLRPQPVQHVFPYVCD